MKSLSQHRASVHLRFLHLTCMPLLLKRNQYEKKNLTSTLWLFYCESVYAMNVLCEFIVFFCVFFLMLVNPDLAVVQLLRPPKNLLIDWIYFTVKWATGTEHLLPRHHGCGTVCHLSCGNPNCHMDNLGFHLRHFYLGSRVTGAVWPLLTAPYKNTYLLTYLYFSGFSSSPLCVTFTYLQWQIKVIVMMN